MDVSARQMVSVATAMIPFLEHDDANRALMGSNMQRQAVPLVQAEASAGRHRHGGTAPPSTPVTWSSRPSPASSPRSRPTSSPWPTTTAPRPATGWRSSSAPTRAPRTTSACWSTRATGSRQGGVIADGPSTDDGELALGKNLLVAFMSWEGHNFEDAIILSPAPGAGRRPLLDPHRGARGRRPRHQARCRGDHPRHPQRLRGGPRGPRRARHHPDRRRGRPRRHPGRQGHAQGRDRADPGGAAAARDLRREGARGARHLAQGAPRRVRHGHRRQACSTATRATSCPRASTSWSGCTWPRSARSPTATSWPAATATRASSPRSCPWRTCRSSRTAPRSTSSSTRSASRAG